ncbi:unnamed protein product, partial [Hapterophycus canaliculatus]
AERCIAELQRGRAIALTDATTSTSSTDISCHFLQLVESMSDQALEALMIAKRCQLVLSRPRALALGLMVDSSAVCLELASNTPVQTVRNWAGLNPMLPGNGHDPANHLGGNTLVDAAETIIAEKRFNDNIRCAKASLNLAHHAHVLPAFIMHAAESKPDHILGVNTQAALSFGDHSGKLM